MCTGECVCIHVCQREQAAISPPVYNGSSSPTLTHLSALVQQPALLEDHDSLHQRTADGVYFNNLLHLSSSLALVVLKLCLFGERP